MQENEENGEPDVDEEEEEEVDEEDEEDDGEGEFSFSHFLCNSSTLLFNNFITSTGFFECFKLC